MPITSSPVQVPPPLISAPRITTLVVSLIVAVSAGTKYVSRDSVLQTYQPVETWIAL